MAFKEAHSQFQMIDVALIEPDRSSPRQKVDETALKGLVHSIRKVGVIHPVSVQPANPLGMYTLIVGERRWRAAVIAGEQTIPALIRSCAAAEVLDVQVSENMGLGVRAALEPRDMANAIQSITERFDNKAAAAEHLGGSHAWLKQATAAATANLSPKISALLDSGKISSAGAAIQLEKLAQKNEARAESLMGLALQSESEKLSRKMVDRALQDEGGRRKKRAARMPEMTTTAAAISLGGHAETPAERNGKIGRVARILGIPDGDEAEVLTRLIDEFLAMKEDGNRLL